MISVSRFLLILPPFKLTQKGAGPLYCTVVYCSVLYSTTAVYCTVLSSPGPVHQVPQVAVVGAHVQYRVPAGRHVTRVQAADAALTHHSWDRDLADTAQPEEVGDSWKEMSSTYLSTVYNVNVK